MKRHQIIALIIIALGIPFLFGSTIIQSAYSLIENNGTPLTRRTILNFTNSGCSDSASPQRTNCAFLTSGTLPSNYTQSFVSQTSVTLTHNLNTLAVIVQCFDAASPPAFIIPNTILVTSVNVVTVTFVSPQSGRCQVNGSNGSGAGGGFIVNGPYLNNGTDNYIGLGYQVITPFSALATWINQGTSTATTNSGAIALKMQNDSAVHALLTAAYPSTPFTRTLAITPSSAFQSDTHIGIVVTDGTKFTNFNISTISGAPQWSIINWNPGFAGIAQSAVYFSPTDIAYLRLTDDGTNFTFYLSVSGLENDFIQLGTPIARGSFLGSPTGIGVSLVSSGANAFTNFTALSFK